MSASLNVVFLAPHQPHCYFPLSFDYPSSQCSTLGGRPAVSAMSLWYLFSTLVGGPRSVLILVLLLRLSVRLWHKSRLWDLQCCSTDLTGKVAVVTGANSGECSYHPITSVGASAPNSLNREGGGAASTVSTLVPPLAPLPSRHFPD